MFHHVSKGRKVAIASSPDVRTTSVKEGNFTDVILCLKQGGEVFVFFWSKF